MITVRCSSCGESYQVGDENAGQTLKCPACQASIAVSARTRTLVEGVDVSQAKGRPNPFGPAPSVSASAAPPPPKPAPRPPSPPRVASPVAAPAAAGSGSKVGIIIASVIGGVVVLGGMIAGIVIAIVSANSDGDGGKKSGRDRDDGGGDRGGFTGLNATGTGTVAGNSPHERAVNEVVAQLKLILTAAEGVRSQATAQSAARTISRAADEIDHIVDRAKRLPKLSADEGKKMGEKLKRTLAPYKTRFQRLGPQSEFAQWARKEPTLQTAMGKFVRAIKRMETIGD